MNVLPEGTLALVASAADPSYVEHTIDVGGSPVNVPAKRLQVALTDKATYPFAKSGVVSSPGSFDVLAEFLQANTTGGVTFEADGTDKAALFAEDESAVIVVEQQKRYSREFTLTVAAKDRGMAQKWLDALHALLPDWPPPPPPEPLPHNVVPVRFWMQDPYTKEAYSRRRNITIHEWTDVQPNYSGEARTALDSLMTLTEPSGGKLMLMHGPPGGGKTRAILTLISEWRDWCTASVVTDADRFFGDPTYLNSLVFNTEGMDRWLLLIIEDADEFINVKGRETKGQSIARLLNLADGIVGQGLNLMTLMTTNVDVSDLNPALIRNGRCMANVHVGEFSADEGTAWLQAQGVEASMTSPAMLADLYATLNAQPTTTDV